MGECWRELREEVERIPEVVEKQVEETPIPEGLGERPVVLIGSGDSYAAALAAHAAGLGLALDPLDAIVGPTPEKGDAILLSVGGRSRRVVEAAELLSSRGFRVIALTSDPQSPLARRAHVTIRLVYSRLACGVGAARHAAMIAALAVLSGTRPRPPEPRRALAETIPFDPMIVYTGVGIGVSSALYTVLKTCEILADCATHWHLEQFSHAPVYGTKSSHVVIFGDPRCPGKRLTEYIRALREANFEVTLVPSEATPWDTILNHLAIIVASAASEAEARNIVEPGYQSHPALERLTKLIYLEE